MVKTPSKFWKRRKKPNKKREKKGNFYSKPIFHNFFFCVNKKLETVGTWNFIRYLYYRFPCMVTITYLVKKLDDLMQVFSQDILIIV